MSQSFENMMKELQAEYMETLPSKIDEIRAVLAAPDQDAWRVQFHKLKGTGKTYGLPEVSLLAATMEKICTQSTGNLSSAVEIAADLLEVIHKSRIQKESEFPLSEDPRYKKLEQVSL